MNFINTDITVRTPTNIKDEQMDITKPDFKLFSTKYIIYFTILKEYLKFD